MTDDRMALIEQIQKSTDGDFLRAIAEHTLHRLMDFEVEALIGEPPGADPHAAWCGRDAVHQDLPLSRLRLARGREMAGSR